MSWKKNCLFSNNEEWKLSDKQFHFYASQTTIKLDYIQNTILHASPPQDLLH